MWRRRSPSPIALTSSPTAASSARAHPATSAATLKSAASISAKTSISASPPATRNLLEAKLTTQAAQRIGRDPNVELSRFGDESPVGVPEAEICGPQRELHRAFLTRPQTHALKALQLANRAGDACGKLADIQLH